MDRLIGLGGAGSVVALAAERLVDVLLTELDDSLAGGESVGVVGEIAALDANGVDLLDVLGDGHQARHRAERMAEEVGVEAGDDDSEALVGQYLDYLDDRVAEKLRLIDADHLDVIIDLQHPGGIGDRCGGQAMQIVRDDIDVRVADVDGRLEDGYLLIGELGSFETAYKLLRLTGEH